VERTRRTSAVADPGHRDDILSKVAARDRDARHHGNQIAKHRDGRNDMTHLEIAEVAGTVFAECGRGVARHVLRENIAWLETLEEQGDDVTNHRRDPVARLECVGRTYGNRFLADA